MICVTICDFGYEACKKAVKRCEKLHHSYPDIVAEIRLDLCGLDQTETSRLFSKASIPMIATCRRRSKALYLPAIVSGASYIDIDTLTPKKEIDEILAAAGTNVKKIFSFHDFSHTPSIKELCTIIRNAANQGADIVHIAVMAGDAKDAENVLSLYELQKTGELPREMPLIAYAMGHRGTYSSFEAVSLGAPFMYCALNQRNGLYPGMPSVEMLEEMKNAVSVSGGIAIPSSKNIAQRLILASIMASGTSVFHNFSKCGDTEVALTIARQRGSSTTLKDDVLSICGRDFYSNKKNHEQKGKSSLSGIYKWMTGSASRSAERNGALFVGDSGLLARLCLPLAAQKGTPISITGEGYLLERDMVSCKQILEQFGARCILTAQGTLPAIVCGPLNGGKITVSGQEGTQFVSGLLMALPLSKKDTTLTVKDATDTHYFLMTVDIMQKFGIDISARTSGNNVIFQIPGQQAYSPVELSIEGDWSSAANFIVAAAIFGSLKIKGLDYSSYQPDKKIVEAVRNSGAEVIVEGYNLTVRRVHPRSFTFDASQNTDLFPILAVLAAYCDGESHITGLKSVKNRDDRRVDTLCEGLRRMGVQIRKNEDEMTISGMSYSRRLIEGKRLKGGTLTSAGDHRVAMALLVAGIGCSSKLYIDDVDCIAKSYPSFRHDLTSVINK